MPRQPAEPVLGQRALNRATLQRQLLLARAKLAPTAAVEHLAGLQHQSPNAPYWALWARLEGFRAEALTRLMVQRRLLRCAAMRGTLHLLSARDLLSWRPRVQTMLMRALMSNHGRHLQGLDLAELGWEGRVLLCGEPLNLGQLGQRLAEQRPGRDTNALAVAVRCAQPLVHVPPAGTWDSFQNAVLLPADVWLGQPLGRETLPDPMILRYLAAFGPATAQDITTWSGIGAMQEALERLAPRLRRYRDEDGRLLLDLRNAHLPDADTPAPVRLTGEFDNLVLSHADRRRLLDDEHRGRIMTINGLVRPCVLVDGRVQGIWKIETGKAVATLTVTPFRRFSAEEQREISQEAERALSFGAPAGVKHGVRFAGVA
jgi:hypothetical protein